MKDYLALARRLRPNGYISPDDVNMVLRVLAEYGQEIELRVAALENADPLDGSSLKKPPMGD